VVLSAIADIARSAPLRRPARRKSEDINRARPPAIRLRAKSSQRTNMTIAIIIHQ
jgi:hypothetical protein